MRWHGAWLALALLAACRTPASAEPVAPDRFMAQLLETRYQNLPANAAAPAVPKAIFDLPLQRLMRPDPKTGEMRIDFDPVCNCQDFDISGIDSRLLASDRDSALVEVHFINAGTPVNLRYTLRRDGKSWRIADIKLPGQGSLVALLGGKPPATPTAGGQLPNK